MTRNAGCCRRRSPMRSRHENHVGSMPDSEGTVLHRTSSSCKRRFDVLQPHNASVGERVAGLFFPGGSGVSLSKGCLCSDVSAVRLWINDRRRMDISEKPGGNAVIYILRILPGLRYGRCHVNGTFTSQCATVNFVDGSTESPGDGLECIQRQCSTFI